MRITTTDVQTDDSLVHVHAANCSDLQRRHYDRVTLYTDEFASLEEIAYDSYGDQIGEGSTTLEQAINELRVFPCVDLPQKTVVIEESPQTIDDMDPIARMRVAMTNTQIVITDAWEDDEKSQELYTLLSAVSLMKNAIEEYESVTNRIADSTLGYAYDSFRLNELVSAEYRIKVWNEVIAKSSESKRIMDTRVTIDVLQATAAGFAKRLLNGWDVGTSTDPMSNALSRIANEENARFVNHFSGQTLTVAEVK